MWILVLYHIFYALYWAIFTIIVHPSCIYSFAYRCGNFDHDSKWRKLAQYRISVVSSLFAHLWVLFLSVYGCFYQVIGPYRSGKSFLLNQLLSLSCYEGASFTATRIFNLITYILGKFCTQSLITFKDLT